jgi:hypothetical protein
MLLCGDVIRIIYGYYIVLTLLGPWRLCLNASCSISDRIVWGLARIWCIMDMSYDPSISVVPWNYIVVVCFFTTECFIQKVPQYCSSWSVLCV